MATVRDTDRVAVGGVAESLPSPFARISWGAILAGVVIVLSLQILLNMLGLGVGLTMVDPAEGTTPGAATFSLAAGIWWVVSNLIAVFAGGYVAARLAGSYRARDGALHGLVTWGFTLLLGVFLLTTAVGGMLGGAMNMVGNVAGSATQAISQAVPEDLRQALPTRMEDAAQALLRGDPSNMSPEQAAAELAKGMTQLIASPDGQGVDRERLAQIIAQQSGVSQDEAMQRLQQWEQQARQTAQQTVEQTRQAADRTAAAASQASIWGFVALVLGAIAAACGGLVGVRRDSTEPQVAVGRRY